MKIALFSHVYNPFTNGVATSVEQLANQLKSRDHDVTIVTNNYDSFRNKKEDGMIKVISIPIFYQNLRTPLLINPKLFKLLKESNVELIHSHSDFGLALLGRIYAKKDNIPLIQTYHCNYLEYARENFGKASYNIFYGPVNLYTKALCYSADRVIVPSKDTQSLLKERFNIKKNIDLIPNGIDLDKFKVDINYTKELKKNLNISDDDFVLLSVSRLSKEKRIDDLIRVLPYLSDCQNLKMVIVGGGKEEENLKKLVQELKLTNVIFTGEIPFSKIQYYYQLGDLFITNSIAETQALTPIEALASSIPCICPNIPLYRDLVVNNYNGFLYRDFDELIKIIKTVYNNREFVFNMKDEARKSVNRFSLNNSISKIEDLYLEEHKKCLKKVR